MPKGSPQRAEAMEAYRARKAELEGQADGGYQFDPGAAQG
jgi:hypothetical protein